MLIGKCPAIESVVQGFCVPGFLRVRSPLDLHNRMAVYYLCPFASVCLDVYLTDIILISAVMSV
jgi:hypothetical protein